MGLISYLKNSKAEFKHISWPTRKQAIGYTILVIVITALVTTYLALLDEAFAKLVAAIIS